MTLYHPQPQSLQQSSLLTSDSADTRSTEEKSLNDYDTSEFPKYVDRSFQTPLHTFPTPNTASGQTLDSRSASRNASQKARMITVIPGHSIARKPVATVAKYSGSVCSGHSSSSGNITSRAPRSTQNHHSRHDFTAAGEPRASMDRTSRTTINSNCAASESAPDMKVNERQETETSFGSRWCRWLGEGRRARRDILRPFRRSIASRHKPKKDKNGRWEVIQPYEGT